MLDSCQNFLSAQYLENKWTEFDQIFIHIYIGKILDGIVKGHFHKFCIQINIDKIKVGVVNHHFTQMCNRVTAFDRELWPLIVVRTFFLQQSYRP